MDNHYKPCGNIHPLPCGLDVDCKVPAKHFEAELTDEEVWENYQENA